MIVSSWNVNSVRARLENIKEYLKKFSPDIVLIQEIKTEDKTYPYDEIKSLGYESYVFGQKSYNGVAILSKGKVNNIKNKKTIIIAYEPVWSIGTGIIPKQLELLKTINFLKKKLKDNKILYGGSVNSKNINQLKSIYNLDGYLIGGASQDPKKFIDIIKKTYN